MELGESPSINHRSLVEIAAEVLFSGSSFQSYKALRFPSTIWLQKVLLGLPRT